MAVTPKPLRDFAPIRALGPHTRVANRAFDDVVVLLAHEKMVPAPYETLLHPTLFKPAWRANDNIERLLALLSRRADKRLHKQAEDLRVLRSEGVEWIGVGAVQSS
jgi:hypothetical protein